jgi:multiple sugar transport system substrate-binding protein
MAEAGSPFVCAPLAYGYVSYAMPGFRAKRLSFADMPAAGPERPVGSVIGGTGVAVSAFSGARDAAIDFAYWIASGDVQRGPYARAGGQPAHAAAWEDATVNGACGDFYRSTRATLDSAWVRPRYDGYMAFQQTAAERLREGLAERHAARRVVEDLNRLRRVGKAKRAHAVRSIDTRWCPRGHGAFRAFAHPTPYARRSLVRDYSVTNEIRSRRHPSST